MKVDIKNREAMHKLLDAVINAQNKGLCGFYNFSGHVDWVEVVLAQDAENYSTRVFSRGTMKTCKKEYSNPISSFVDEVISEMKEVVKNMDAHLKKIKEQETEEEKVLLKELKQKYEG